MGGSSVRIPARSFAERDRVFSSNSFCDGVWSLVEIRKLAGKFSAQEYLRDGQDQTFAEPTVLGQALTAGVIQKVLDNPVL
jgi:hypothetical protein